MSEREQFEILIDRRQLWSLVYEFAFRSMGDTAQAALAANAAVKAKDEFFNPEVRLP